MTSTVSSSISFLASARCFFFWLLLTLIGALPTLLDTPGGGELARERDDVVMDMLSESRSSLAGVPGRLMDVILPFRDGALLSPSACCVIA